MVTILNFVTLWTTLVIFAGSAVMALVQAYRRDRTGFIDRTALKALPTLAVGVAGAGIVLLLPKLVLVDRDTRSHDPMPINPTRLSDAITNAWVWAATATSVVWLYAVAAALVTAVIYRRQQRRLHADS